MELTKPPVDAQLVLKVSFDETSGVQGRLQGVAGEPRRRSRVQPERLRGDFACARARCVRAACADVDSVAYRAFPSALGVNLSGDSSPDDGDGFADARSREHLWLQRQ